MGEIKNTGAVVNPRDAAAMRRRALRRCADLGLLALLGTLGLPVLAREGAEDDGLAEAGLARAFAATDLETALADLGAWHRTEGEGLRLNLPEVAEDGATVAVSVVSQLPGTRSIALLVEHNPTVLAALVDFPLGGPAAFSTAIKMDRSSPVLALARTDGGFFMVARTVEVIQGGCG